MTVHNPAPLCVALERSDPRRSSDRRRVALKGGPGRRRTGGASGPWVGSLSSVLQRPVLYRRGDCPQLAFVDLETLDSSFETTD
jgi:hypothetical protein